MRYAYIMRRTTVVLSEDVDARLRFEARRRGVSLGELVRTAIEAYLPEPKGPLGFFAVGDGAPRDASERTEEFVSKTVAHRARRP
jgi:hypothetical protein